MLASSSETRLAISVFSPQVETNRRYFCLLSKNRKAGGRHRVADLFCADSRCGASRQLILPRRRRLGAHRQVGSDFFERFGGDPCAVAKPRDELPVVDDAASECRFRRSAFRGKNLGFHRGSDPISHLADDAGELRGSWPIRVSTRPQSSDSPSRCQPQSEWADGVGSCPLSRRRLVQGDKKPRVKAIGAGRGSRARAGGQNQARQILEHERRGNFRA